MYARVRMPSPCLTPSPLTPHNLPPLSLLQFCEALCRLSLCKSLPTAAELEELECPDACTYLLQLSRDENEAYTNLIRQRQGEWGVPRPDFPLELCVEYLIQMLIVLCQGGLDRKPDEPIVLTKKQVAWGILEENVKEAGKSLLA